MMPAEAVFKQPESLHSCIATRELEDSTVVAQPKPLGPTLTILEGRDSALSTTSINSKDSTVTVHSDVFQKDGTNNEEIEAAETESEGAISHHGTVVPPKSNAVVQKKKNALQRMAGGRLGGRRQRMQRPPPQMIPISWPIPPGCPPGLEWLVNASGIFIEQQVEFMELLTGFETNNKYVVLNNWGQPIYFAMEDTDCMMRMCCGADRGFTVNIFDIQMRPTMVVTRPFKVCGSTFCCNEISIEAPPGFPNGVVKEQFKCCKAANYMVLNLNNENAMYIQGPQWGTTGCAICCDIKWEVQDPATGTPLGTISKVFSGAVKEFFTDADNFAITFPPYLDVRIKANLMAVTFLIDFMFFEKSQNDNGMM